jgi:hypothetical protein
MGYEAGRNHQNAFKRYSHQCNPTEIEDQGKENQSRQERNIKSALSYRAKIDYHSVPGRAGKDSFQQGRVGVDPCFNLRYTSIL